MPTYEYECDACGHAFELLQSMSDRVIRKCPKCKKLRVRRLISGGAGVIFKGSGFYETDYKRNRPGASRPKEGEGGDAPSKPSGSEGSGSGRDGAGKDGGKDRGTDGGGSSSAKPSGGPGSGGPAKDSGKPSKGSGSGS